MSYKIDYTIDLKPFGEHVVEVEFCAEIGEDEYHGDNGSAPATPSNVEIVGITKDGIDVYAMVEAHEGGGKDDAFETLYKYLKSGEWACDDDY